MRKSLSKTYCNCIKKVRRTIKPRKSTNTKEQSAIAICTKSVLQTRGRTLKRFACKNTPFLITQPKKHNKGLKIE
jgi:hypothetical protein